jgi:acetoin utilization deacetylase AcuC-like enzyme
MAFPTVFTSPSCLEHDAGPGHPESPERLRVLLARLVKERAFPVLEAPPAPLEAVARVHPASYLDRLARIAARGGGVLDADTVMSAGSWDAALAAAGAALAAVRHAHGGNGTAFAAIRPPGHHALAERAMGFCLLANAVIAAREAQALGRERILIVDWDVHHGNGTQALVEQDPAIRFVSLHQWPAYPGTGAASERGVGNIFNLPRLAGLPPERYVTDLLDGVQLATDRWQPDLIIVSAGYDSLAGDPLGGFTLEPPHFAELATAIRERCPGAPIVGILEGGYWPERVADGVLATLGALI